MRIIDLHCYPGTQEWIACQGRSLVAGAIVDDEGAWRDGDRSAVDGEIDQTVRH